MKVINTLIPDTTVNVNVVFDGPSLPIVEIQAKFKEKMMFVVMLDKNQVEDLVYTLHKHLLDMYFS